MQNDQTHEQFTDNPEENLRIENDILKLKLRASYGAGMMMNSVDALPPEVENEFLRNVIAFEESLEKEELQSVYSKIGEPQFQMASELLDDQVSAELIRVNVILETHGIQLDVLGKYEDRIIYSFITEELFRHEIVSGTAIPGFTYHFIYEEFHPNHNYDIENRVSEFINDWFEQKFDQYSFELSDQLIIADGRTMSKEALMNKIQMVFDSYTTFTETDFTIDDISFQINEPVGSGMGYAEGQVKYYATMENGEQIFIGGPFKFYLSLEGTWWQIFYFVFPGFEWGTQDEAAGG